MSELIRNDEYREWLGSIKRHVQASQIKAAVAVNYAMLEMYWFLGEQIIEKQQTAKWGDGFLKQMSQDLLTEFPEIKGFSYRNLRRMRQWCLFWTSSEASWPQLVAKLGSNWPQAVAATENSEQPSVQQLVAQIPWGHNSVIMEKLKTPADALFYVQKTIENNWSRAVLTHHIESGLHLREGKAVDNFTATLPKPESDLARQLLRDPYNFDFLTLTERHNERELEDGLIDHLTTLLLDFLDLCDDFSEKIANRNPPVRRSRHGSRRADGHGAQRYSHCRVLVEAAGQKSLASQVAQGHHSGPSQT